MFVKAENLSFVYGSGRLSFRALNDINLEINEGEFYGIIGHTGSGKSTFVQHINGLIKIEKNRGKLTVGEFDLTQKKCNFKDLRKKVGMVFQYPEYQLFAETVEDDIAFGLKNFCPEMDEKAKKQAVKEAMESVGLDYEKYRAVSPFELSGGQKRRVAIAGVIVTKPELLILDEPVAGLDPEGKREFTALLHQLKSKFVKTIIIVSHDMDFVAENCTRVAVFSEGSVIAEGTPKEIFAKTEVRESGLGMPLTAFVCDKLAQAGVDLDCDLTTEDFIEKVANTLQGRGDNA